MSLTLPVSPQSRSLHEDMSMSFSSSEEGICLRVVCCERAFGMVGGGIAGGLFGDEGEERKGSW